MNEGDVIGACADVRYQAADLFATLTAGLPVPRAFHYYARLALEQFHFAARIEFPAASLNKQRFVIKCIALAGRPGHEQLDDPPGPGRMMQSAVEFGPGRRRLRQHSLLPEQMGECNAAQPASEAPEELPPVN